VRRHFTKKVSALAPYQDYILMRWEQGCHNATQTWQEIYEQGYLGGYQNVVRINWYKEQERLVTYTGLSTGYLRQPRRGHSRE
jgi:hypothetical protein